MVRTGIIVLCSNTRMSHRLRAGHWHAVVGTQHLRESLGDLEQRFSEQLQRMASLETAVAAVRDTSFRAESDASHAVSLSADNKRVCGRCEDALLRLGHDVEGLDRQVQRLRDRSPRHHSLSEEKSIRRDVNADMNVQALQDALRDLTSQVARQDEKLAALSKLLEEHRHDYQEVVSRLSNAARKAKAGNKELSERVLAIGDIKRSVEQVLNDVILSSEGDREALETMKAETASALTEIDSLRTSIVELAEIMPTLQDISETVQDRLAAYHDDEVLPLNDKIADLEQQLISNTPDNVTLTNPHYEAVNSTMPSLLTDEPSSSQHMAWRSGNFGRDTADSNALHRRLQGVGMELYGTGPGAEKTNRSSFLMTR